MTTDEALCTGAARGINECQDGRTDRFRKAVPCDYDAQQICYTNPPDNYIRVALEADLPTFANQQLEYEAQGFDLRLVLVTSDEERFKAVGFWQSSKLDEQSAAQLGQLLVLSQATDSE